MPTITAGRIFAIGLALSSLHAAISLAADQAVSGRRLLMVQTLSGGRLVFLSRDAIFGPSPGGPDDPTATGATFTVTSGTSGETTSFALPAGNWTTNASGTVFQYHNSQAPAGPSAVKTALIKSGKRLQVAAKATGITLDEPSQGSINLTLTSGTRRYRASFGGTVVRDEPNRFLARNAPPPAAIRITTPTGGAVIQDYSVLVRGTLDAVPPGEVSVTVNGTVALIGAGQFAGTVSVDPTVTALAATLTSAAGTVLAQHTIPITVQMPTSEPALSFFVSPAFGTAPFTTNLTITYRVSPASLTLDADGDGSVDRQGPHLDDQAFTYNQAGLFLATVTLTDDGGGIHRASVPVRVLAAGELDGLIQPKWRAMKDALRAGDVSGPLQHIAIRKRDLFQGYFTHLTVALASIDQALTDITFKEQRGTNAEFEMVRDQGGRHNGYVVIFVLDDDGIWRLKAL